MPFPLNSGLGGFSSNTVISGQQAGIGNSPEFTGLTFEPYIIELPVADPSFAGSTPIFVNDLTGDSGLDPKVAFSRASTAWDFDKNGNVVSFANDVPRIGWDSDGLGNFVKNGVLIEEQRTNLALNSGDLTSAWTVFTLTRSSDTTLTPHGTTAAKYTETATASTTHGVFNNAQFAISSGSVYTVSIFQHAGTKQFVYLAFQDNGAGTNYISAVFNLTGVAPTTATQTSSGLSGSLLSTSQTYMGNGWYRLTITGSITSSAAFLLFGPAAAATGNTLDSGGLPVFTGSTANTFYASLPQVELGSFATSPIITSATAVTRSADIPSSTDAGLLGALAWSIETASMKAATAATILGVNTGIGIQAKANNTLGYDTGSQATANTADWTAVNRSFFAFDGTPRVSIGLDGGAVATAATSPVTPTSLYFGNTNAGASGFLNGRIRRFAAYTSLTDAQGVEASTPYFSFLIDTGGVSASVGAAAGVGTATAIGQTIVNVVGTAAGAGTATAVGAALFSGVGAAAGSGAATATGKALFSGVGAAAGSGVATGVGAAIANSVGAAAGSGAASGVGQSTAASVGVAAGSGAASGVGASTAASVGSAAGSGAATATGKALFSGVGSAAGSGAATGIGASTAASVGTAAGLGTATGIGKSTAASVGTAAGSGAATGIGASIAKAVGASAGVGTATALAAGASIATAAGVGTATGVGRAIVNAVGTAVGGATVTATGKALFSGIGTAAGSGTATGVGSTAGTVVSAVGTAAGSALAQAVSSSIVVGSSDFTGSPWRIGTDKVPAQFASPPWMVAPRDLPIEPPAGDYVGEFSAADFSADFSTTLTFTVGDTPIGGKVPHSLAWRLARNSNNSALTFQNWTVE